MIAALQMAPVDDSVRAAMGQFFLQGSAYLVGKREAELAHPELADRWNEQRMLDELIAAIAERRDQEAIRLAPRFASRPAVCVGILARMIRAQRTPLIEYAIKTLEGDPALLRHRFGGRSLLHFACGAGSIGVVECLLRLGADPNSVDRGGHTPLYCVANECACEAGPSLVRMLVRAGAEVNAAGGVTHASALHMAARRGYTAIASALLDCGAAIDARDSKGVTPLQRAINCRRQSTAEFLMSRGAQGRF